MPDMTPEQLEWFERWYFANNGNDRTNYVAARAAFAAGLGCPLDDDPPARGEGHPLVRKWLDGNNDAGGCIADLEREVERLCAGIEGLRRTWHDECEDAWYSCSQNPECANGSRRGDPCDCGMDAFNEKLDALLNPSLTVFNGQEAKDG